MFVSIFIITVSALLFAYWFRYTCLLILSTQSSRDYAPEVASANNLTFLEARAELSSDSQNAATERLHKNLDRDYRLLSYLLRHAAAYHVNGSEIDEQILRLDYKLMSLWIAVVRPFSNGLARKALLEKISIVNHLANTMGERVAVSTRA